MKILLSIMLLFITTISFAQDGLYETIDKNGPEVKYREFYSVSKGEKDGTTKVDGEREWVTAKVEKAKSGEKIGLDIIKNDGSSFAGMDVLSRYVEVKGYPNVSYIYHEMRQDAYIAVDDYIIELNGISADGLSFKSIGTVYVKKQTEEEKETNKSEEPKKKSKFLAGLEKAALGALSSEPKVKLSLEAKKVMSVNLHQIATNYLKAMKTKQNAYTLSSKDKSEIASMITLRKEKYEGFKKENAEFMKTSEGKALSSTSKNKSGFSYYYVKNTTGSSIDIGGNGWSESLSPGSTKEMICDREVYYKYLNGSAWQQGSLISDGKDVCEKTITL